VEKCRCGFDLRQIETPEVEATEAESELIAINAAIYRSAGFPIGIGHFDLGNESLPVELAGLSLDDLIGFICACASFSNGDKSARKPALTYLGTAMSVAYQAARFLRKWPSGFHNRLRELLPVPENDRGVITFRGLYGDYYQYLLDAAHRVEFRFLTDAFDEFVMRDWPGLLRGQHRIVPQTMRGEKRWIPALQAAKRAGLTTSQITDLVRKGVLTGVFVNPPKGRGRVECWLDSTSLTQWVACRDADFGRFISQAEVMQLLGLNHRHVLPRHIGARSRWVLKRSRLRFSSPAIS
jgi:hypothetical protein